MYTTSYYLCSKLEFLQVYLFDLFLIRQQGQSTTSEMELNGSVDITEINISPRQEHQVYMNPYAQCYLMVT